MDEASAGSARSGGSAGAATTVGLALALAVPLLYGFVVGPALADALGETGRAVVGYAVM